MGCSSDLGKSYFIQKKDATEIGRCAYPINTSVGIGGNSLKTRGLRTGSSHRGARSSYEEEWECGLRISRINVMKSKS